MQRLIATIQHYDWGDREFIATLQGRSPSELPEAELWAGVHPGAPSSLEAGGTLGEAIAADPLATLGQPVFDEYGNLPFLAKILAAAQPLSLQAHPSIEQAEAGYARERAAGISVDSPASVYRDRNHKPELICALTPFEAKCGFQPVKASLELFGALDHDGLSELCEVLGSTGSDSEILAMATGWLLRSDENRARELNASVVEASLLLASGSPWDRELSWARETQSLYGSDPAVVASLLLNHVVMEPGQALYLGAGQLHSYLRGSGVEVMTNSDNVIRGGLSFKHIDVEELLAIIDPSPAQAPVQTAEGSVHCFHVPTPEFATTRVHVPAEVRFDTAGPEVLLVTGGRVRFATDGGIELVAGPGTPIWVPASDTGYVANGGGTFYRTAVGTAPVQA